MVSKVTRIVRWNQPVRGLVDASAADRHGERTTYLEDGIRPNVPAWCYRSLHHLSRSHLSTRCQSIAWYRWRCLVHPLTTSDQVISASPDRFRSVQVYKRSYRPCGCSCAISVSLASSRVVLGRPEERRDRRQDTLEWRRGHRRVGTRRGKEGVSARGYRNYNNNAERVWHPHELTVHATDIQLFIRYLFTGPFTVQGCRRS